MSHDRIPGASYYHLPPKGEEIWGARELEVLVEGPAGTGKTRCILERLYAIAETYPGARILICRKTRASVTESCLVTFESQVLPQGHPVNTGISRSSRHIYKFDQGSEIVVGGLDKPSKILSTEWDLIYLNEGTEATEEDWETLLSRLRNGKVPYQQIIADANPDKPSHWLNQRFPPAGSPTADRRRIITRHEDNPAFYDHEQGEWTPRGTAYLKTLEGLTGARRLRLLEGRWAAAEGLIYEEFDANLHILDRPEKINDGWRRIWVVDFGHTNPFVWQDWAIDHDGRAYLVNEIYRTQTLVSDHAQEIMRISAGVKPEAIICDHDAEDRATLERYLGMRTVGAKKDVIPGIQAVQSRLRKASDGKPRIFFFRDSLSSVDKALKEARKPICTVEEMDGYIWDPNVGSMASKRNPKEAPLKVDDHGMDAMRYLVMYLDNNKQVRRKAVGIRFL